MQQTITSIANTLSRPHILFYALPWLIVLLIWGTVIQADIGLYEAQKRFFTSFIFWIGPIPLPGGITTIAIITLNLLFKFLLKSEWRWSKAGINITHLGVLLLMLGGLITATTAKEGFMIIPEGHETAYVYKYDDAAQEVMIHKAPLFTLPFTLKLTDFARETHPATNIPRSFSSDLILSEGETSWPVRIEMNKPLRFQGYTIFQSAFDEKDGIEITVLSVVWNAGRLFPYLASLVIAIGLLLHIGIGLKQGGRKA